ncbi:MAG: cytochrome c oxidase assembly protein [Candidatus Fonsibacter sp.]|jgi:cytochrome c oxidase assembly protein Cox11
MAYFIDPKIADDSSAKEVKDITLSYTFFESEAFKKNKS